jgi:carbon monoxide dehydrogenase subunit G
MKLEQSFEVSAPLERVWATLIDVEHVAPCLPGAAVTGRNDDGSYNGSFSVKIGPTSASYSGKLQMQEIDEAEHRATMKAHGTDKRGQGGADATIVSSLRALGDGRTLVEVSTDYRITGRLARFGRGGMIEDISEKLLRQFAASLQASLQGDAPDVDAPDVDAVDVDSPDVAVDGAPEGAAPAAPKPNGTPPVSASAADDVSLKQPSEISALSLVGSVLLTRLKRNPAAAVGILAALLLLLGLRRRRG